LIESGAELIVAGPTPGGVRDTVGQMGIWHLLAGVGLCAAAALAGSEGAVSAPTPANPAPLKVKVGGLGPNGRLPASAAYCPPTTMDPAKHNISPSVSWSRGPPGTRSYALIMTDLDVPRDLTLINKPGVTITASTPRMPFIHWVLVDIPPSITRLRRGEESSGFVLKGNPIGPTDHGVRGANVFTNYYPKNSPLAGPRGGFDGPCPPHNDSIAHRYVTRVYALDVASVGLSGVFFGEDAERAMQGHVLAMGEADARYASGRIHAPAP
jgi:Raf kinase inhibitor-like YbhB/YbcL family protein